MRCFLLCFAGLWTLAAQADEPCETNVQVRLFNDGSGDVTLQIDTEFGFLYSLETSADMIDWSEIRAFLGVGPTILVLDSGEVGETGARCFRSTQTPASLVLNGRLEEGDHLAVDGSGSFLYDIYRISNPSDEAVAVRLAMLAGPNLRPWGSLWTTEVLPAANWEEPENLYTSSIENVSSSVPGDTVRFSIFEIPAGETFQLGVATQNYIEQGALPGSYQLVFDRAGLIVVPVTQEL